SGRCCHIARRRGENAVGSVEGVEQVFVLVAEHFQVDGAATALRPLAASAADRLIELARRGLCGITNLLCGQTADWHAGEPLVGWVLRGGSGRLGAMRSLAIGGTCHHLAMKALDAPVVVEQLAGEPIEQLGMAWWCSEAAEVAGRFGQAAAKMLLPKAIGQDA